MAVNDIAKMRGMVLAQAGVIANEVVKAATDAELTMANIVRTVKAGEVTWKLEVGYVAELSVVVIEGTPQKEGVPSVFDLFLMGEDDKGFKLAVPVEWLPGTEPLAGL